MRPGELAGIAGRAGSPGRLGPAGPWLKPVLAVSAAVAIVVVGVVILNHETGTLISPSNSVTSPSSQGSGLGSGGTTANSKRWKLPLGVNTQPPSGPAQNPRVKSACCPRWPAPRRRSRPAATTTAPAGGRDRDPDPDPERHRDQHARDTPADRHRAAIAHPDVESGHQRSHGDDRRRRSRCWLDDAGGPAIVECGG